MVHLGDAPESPLQASDAEDDDDVTTTGEPRLTQKPRMTGAMEYHR